MNKKLCFLLLCFAVKTTQADWGSIGSSIASTGESIGSFLQTMGEGMAGSVPSGYDYNFQVFNGSNVSMTVTINKIISVLGADWGHGTGDTQTLAPGTDSGTTFQSEHLYFNIGISGGGQSYSDPHSVLGQRNDPNIYYYHCYNDSQTGLPATELLGAGYTTNSAFSGRIHNNTGQVSSVSYSLTGGSLAGKSQTYLFEIDDIDPHSFNYLNAPSGFSMRPSTLTVGGSSVIVPAQGLAQSATTGPSLPVTINYVILSNGGFETGIGPGNFAQPSGTNQLRDISPVQCQMYNQPAAYASPIGQLLPQSITWQSVWAVYQGSGWSQQNTSVVNNPIWQLPAGASASCFLIRPSQAYYQQNGPARLFIVRLGIPEKPTGSQVTLAQTFLQNLLAGNVIIKGLSASLPQGSPVNSFFSQVPTMPASQLINQFNKNSTTLTNGQSYEGFAPFIPNSSFPAYPAFSQSYLSQGLVPADLTPTTKAQLLGTILPDDIGLLYDPKSGVEGFILYTDVLMPYGSGGGPFYYALQPPYFDVGQMIGALSNYASFVNDQNLDVTSLNLIINSFLPQTVAQWVQHYVRNPQGVEDSIATVLLGIAKGTATQLIAKFTANPFYADPSAKNQLSPQGLALLKMLLYGPCSISQVPTYYAVGSSYQSAPSGWPPTTLQL